MTALRNTSEPNLYNLSKKHCSTHPICTAVTPPCVAVPSWLLSLEERKPHNTSPICTAVRLLFVQQHASHLYNHTFEKVLPGWGFRTAPELIGHCSGTPNPDNLSEKYWQYTVNLYRSAPPICNAVSRWLLSLEERETPQHTSNLYCSTPPICTIARFPPKGPFRTKNSTVLESVVFCYRCSFPHSLYRFLLLVPRETSILRPLRSVLLRREFFSPCRNSLSVVFLVWGVKQGRFGILRFPLFCSGWGFQDKQMPGKNTTKVSLSHPFFVCLKKLVKTRT